MSDSAERCEMLFAAIPRSDSWTNAGNRFVRNTQTPATYNKVPVIRKIKLWMRKSSFGDDHGERLRDYDLRA